MEKNISILTPEVALSSTSKNTRSTIETIKSVANIVAKPINWLSAYYSAVLERKVSNKQTLLLLNAQAAFVMTVFPVEAPFVIRLISLTWFVKALFACKKAF